MPCLRALESFEMIEKENRPARLSQQGMQQIMVRTVVMASRYTSACAAGKGFLKRAFAPELHAEVPAMTRDEYDAICAALPGATRSDPTKGEHDTWQVGGKMFALVFHKLPGFAVKTESPEHAAHLIDLGLGVKAPYFHASWILMPWETAPDEALHRIGISYGLIRAKLPKKVQAALGE
jgi:predicted DNA-binding protein (MmcQ/YjbR family)